MIKKLAALTLAVVLCLSAVSFAAAETYYVKTDNGKTVNIRWTDDTYHAVMAKLPYGTPVDVLATTKNGTWAIITYQGRTLDGEDYYGDAYVMTRFLSKTNPGKYQKPSQGSSSAPAGGTSGTAVTIADLNREFASARKVTYPYTVVARPTRASGWVNLRWAPNTEAERLATCPQGKELTVLAELRNWYQVEDPVTGMIGFISRTFVSVK